MNSPRVVLVLILQTCSAWAKVDLQQKRLFSLSSSPLGVLTKSRQQNISSPQLVSVTDSQPYMVSLLFQFSDSDSAQSIMMLAASAHWASRWHKVKSDLY